MKAVPPVDGCYRQARALMDTVVAVQVPRADAGTAAAVERAFAWFVQVERACSRFDPESEVVRLSRQPGRPVRVSQLLFEAVRFGLALSRETEGAFDIAVGDLMERRGFDRNYRTGIRRRFGTAGQATFGDIAADPVARTITLRRPLLIDLGALAKGLAVDLAARELEPLGDFAIDAGGDVRVRGRNGAGDPWRVGIRNPARPEAIVDVLHLTGGAVCTSGGDLRPADQEGQHHLVDARSGLSPRGLESMTVVAANAMLADGLSTAAFLLGADQGLRLLARHGVQGVALT